MSEVSLTVHEGKKYINQLTNADLNIKEHRKNIMDSFRETGQLIIEDLAKVIYSGGRTGRVYNFRGTKYTASAPGEPPANRSGKLLNSFDHTENLKELRIINTAESERGAPYPIFLEEGTSKMSPRPYFVSTIEKRSEDLRNKLLSMKEV